MAENKKSDPKVEFEVVEDSATENPTSEAAEKVADDQTSAAKKDEGVKITKDADIKDKPLDANNLIPSGEKQLAALGYASFLCILPLALKPKSELCQQHGKQALVITLVFLIFSWLGWLNGGLAALLGIAQVGISVWGASFAWRGKLKKMPFFGEVADKLKW